ncbi:MAG: LysR family transcriptional regulator [Bacteroidetes bacterium]|nr:MAG: LysR family transcriptional regulator [Bacteroidota bacterium]
MLITLRQLQYAIAVSNSGSFSKAADLCFAEQSTVSQQIKLMEEKLGVELFDRSTLPVKVTDEGKIMIEQAKEIIEKVDELLLPFKAPIKKKI